GGTINSSGMYTAPANAGTYHVVATSVADTSKSKTAAVTVTAPPPLTITTSSLPDGSVSSSYSAALSPTRGTTPYTWSMTAGTLPDGLSLGTSSGVISGSPTDQGSSTFTVQVMDSASRTATAGLSLNVSGASPIDQSILPAIYQTTWDPGIPGGIPGD